MSQFSDFMSAKISTAILKINGGANNDKYTIVGSVPVELTYQGKNSLGLPITKTKIFDTEDQAINALLELGIFHFQLSNCLWYDDHLDYLYDRSAN